VWAEASWDGTGISLQARSTDLITPITAVITITTSSLEKLPLVNGSAVVPWQDSKRTPLTARFTQGAETLEVDILDLRAPGQFDKTPMPEVDPEIAIALREAFLLQRYGGPAVDADSIPGLGGEQRSPDIGTPRTDYSVQAWVDARNGFDVVDQWRKALNEAESEVSTRPEHRARILQDGNELRDLYARHESAAVGLVAEEFSWRIEKEV